MSIIHPFSIVWFAICKTLMSYQFVSVFPFTTSLYASVSAGPFLLRFTAIVGHETCKNSWRTFNGDVIITPSSSSSEPSSVVLKTHLSGEIRFSEFFGNWNEEEKELVFSQQSNSHNNWLKETNIEILYVVRRNIAYYSFCLSVINLLALGIIWANRFVRTV